MPHLTPCSCPPHLQLPAHVQALVRIARPMRPRPLSRPTAPNSHAERPQILPVRLQPHRQADDPVHRPRRAHVRRGRQAHRARWAAHDLQWATRGWAEEGHLERLSDAPLLLRRWRSRPATMSRRGAEMTRFDAVRVPRSLHAANRPKRSGTRRMDRSSDHFDLALTARSIRHPICALRRLVDLGGTPLGAGPLILARNKSIRPRADRLCHYACNTLYVDTISRAVRPVHRRARSRPILPWCLVHDEPDSSSLAFVAEAYARANLVSFRA